MTTILYGIYIVIAVLLIVVILMQKSKTRGFGLTNGITAVGDSYYNKNKSKTFEGKLETITKVGIVLFIVLAVVINIYINKGTSNNANLLQQSPEYTGVTEQTTGTETAPTTTTTPATTGEATTGATTPATTIPSTETTTIPAAETTNAVGQVAPAATGTAPVTPAPATTTTEAATQR